MDTGPGSYIVVLVKSDRRIYVGKRFQENPSILKIQNVGKFSLVGIGDCHIQTDLTEKLQEMGPDSFLAHCREKGIATFSGLAKFGSENGEIRQLT